MKLINQIRTINIVRPITKHYQILPKQTITLTRFYSKFNEKYQGPPKLPEKEQKEFERLQNIAMSQIAIEDYNDRVAASLSSGDSGMQDIVDRPPTLETNKEEDNSDIGNFAYLKIIPEFEGDINPKTGERGGPKQDPLKGSDEWTFNGRTIDF
ncbi:uncharacterized protein KGF55_004910 [Candida pseudojiufengensis]|uniref:uncharacterized protein n=1 Tax=Candida pseudojiufengensis TaxID=497109 RepID=UPI0022248389|nr:uncharacterized protein KGF55_004910 [Candida pseudojiufengensis]KAI5960187.1 hypothetical protein KGF55_004910 [Candida pseudojiufengensis]